MKTTEFTHVNTDAHAPLIPPFVCDGTPRMITVSRDVIALAAENRVGVYVRSGDNYELRGEIDTSVREVRP